MQTASESREFEVYCPHCRVTFPVGTRRCLHCNGRVGPRTSGAELPEALPAALQHLAGLEDVELEQEEAPSAIGGMRRIGSVLLWVVIALGAAISRFCSEGGTP